MLDTKRLCSDCENNTLTFLLFVCFQVLFLYLYHRPWLSSLLFKRLWHGGKNYDMIQ